MLQHILLRIKLHGLNQLMAVVHIRYAYRCGNAGELDGIVDFKFTQFRRRERDCVAVEVVSSDYWSQAGVVPRSTHAEIELVVAHSRRGSLAVTSIAVLVGGVTVEY